MPARLAPLLLGKFISCSVYGLSENNDNVSVVYVNFHLTEASLSRRYDGLSFIMACPLVFIFNNQ